MVKKVIQALQNAKHEIIVLLYDIGHGKISKEMAIEKLDEIGDFIAECRANIK